MKHLITLILAAVSLSAFAVKNENTVKVSTFNKAFPTYEMEPDDPLPYFKDFNVPGLTYFRGSRSVYPYTFQGDYRPGKIDKEYEVVRLENEFIIVDIIPELRGRIQGAIDKRNGWDFLYYNHVIKPAEIAVRSAWISGGLEYNHPQGHGYTQFNKISHDILHNEDGSISVVIAETEPVRMMKWEYEIILRPGRLYVETKGRFISTVPYRVPFLSSNNAAMHATDEMELIYPQETHAANHGIRDMKKWPYYGSDYADWNWFKNIKTNASAFVDGSGLLQDYWGVYSHDEGIDAGTVIVSDHREAPGKKFFTWGSHKIGRQWDHFLSDNDGGYVELQQQAYYSTLGYGYAVLDPFEVKEFSIYWYPIKETGGFVKATKEVVINCRKSDESNLEVLVQATEPLQNAKVTVLENGVPIEQIQKSFEAGGIDLLKTGVSLAKGDTYGIRIYNNGGEEILAYDSQIDAVEPEVNKLPEIPEEEMSIDQLYSKALSNYHDPFGTDADALCEKIFALDPLESRANRLMGTISIKRGDYSKAIEYLLKSLKNDHFNDHFESLLLLGYAHLRLDNLDDAHKYLVQASRRKAELEASLYYLTVEQVLRGNFHRAYNQSLEVPLSKATHPGIWNLLAYISRKLGHQEEAEAYLEKAFEIDPINFVGWIETREQYPGISGLDNRSLHERFDRNDPTFLGSQNYIDTAIFYIHLGDHEMALKVIDLAEENYTHTGHVYPLIHYYKGYCLNQLGESKEGEQFYAMASKADYRYVFPYRLETISVLEDVLARRPKDSIALMYMGDLMYYLRRHNEAIAFWKSSYDLDNQNYRVERNLGVAEFVEHADADGAIEMLERAFVKSNKEMRIFSELEQLYILNQDWRRLERLYDENRPIVYRKAEHGISAADFYTRIGRFEDALEVMSRTYFNAAEHGVGLPIRHTRYAEACLGLGEKYLSDEAYSKALECFHNALEYPDYLNEIKVDNPVCTRTYYLLGKAYNLSGDHSNANRFFKLAVEESINENSLAMVYQAMALQELGKRKESRQIIKSMIDELTDKGSKLSAVDEYVLSKAYDFLGDKDKSAEYLDAALSKNLNVPAEASLDSNYIKNMRR